MPWRSSPKQLLILAALTLVVVACGRQGGSDTAQSASRPADVRGTGDATLLPEDRLDLPEFDFELFQDLLEELRGTLVVVNIWGSWCPPCRVEAPDLAKLAREFEGKVQFLGVDILDSREAARAFILEFDWPYPSVFDPKGEIRDRLGYLGQPITIVYDASGAKTFEWAGALTADLLRPEIQAVL